MESSEISGTERKKTPLMYNGWSSIPQDPHLAMALHTALIPIIRLLQLTTRDSSFPEHLPSYELTKEEINNA